MAAIITSKFRLNNAEQFVESFSESAATAYYLFIGRSSTWQTDTDVQGNTVNEGTDSSPPTPNDDVSSEFYNYDEMLGLKRLLLQMCLKLFLKESGQLEQLMICMNII
jgi:hypothetical protein